MGARYIPATVKRTGRRALLSSWRGAAMVAAGLLGSAPAWAVAPNVPTYHGDSARTGWNAVEPALTPSVVSGSSFRQLLTVPLDEQVDAQPLVVSAQMIAGQGIHDTVYVVTENNTVYAIDLATGQVLLSRNLGTPVPASQVPGYCPNNSGVLGITATPTIDLASGTLYLISYNFESGQQVYRVHALDLSTLADKVPAPAIKTSAVLSNGVAYKFNAHASRLRAGLLFSGGNLYAAFTSFCDNIPDQTRGWVLGWQGGTLSPLKGRRLTNRLGASPDSSFLSTVWMSGYGIAADPTGNLFFVTANSDPNAPAYYPYNLAQSVVKLSGDLTTVSGYFSPSNPVTGRSQLDLNDDDFGAGGVMVLPQQPGQYPNLAVAAGKVGQMYLLNRDSLGGGTIPRVSTGCWAPSTSAGAIAARPILSAPMVSAVS